MEDSKYLVLLISTPSGKGGATIKTLFETKRVEEIPLIEAFFKERANYQHDLRFTRNARKVYVSDVLDEYADYLGVVDKFSQRIAAPVTVGQVFPSAMAASRHLGLDYNAVSNALANADSKGSGEADVRGVSFRWYDSIRD